MESTDRFVRPRRRLSSPLPTATFGPMSTPLEQLSAYGEEIILGQMKNRASSGYELHVISRFVLEADQDGNPSTRELFQVQAGTRVLGEFSIRQQADQHAQMLLEQRDFGGYRECDGGMIRVRGRLGGPDLPSLELVVDSGRAVVAQGERLIGVLPDDHQKLFVAALRSGHRFTVNPEIYVASGTLGVLIAPS